VLNNSAERPARSRPKVQLVTFKQLAQLAGERGWTVQNLAERFRGRIENPSDFFTCVLSGKFPDTIIPYRSVLDFFVVAQAVTPDDRAACACGCGLRVFDRKKYALPGCKTRATRARVRDPQFRAEQVFDFVDARRCQNRGVATLPLADTTPPKKRL